MKLETSAENIVMALSIEYRLSVPIPCYDEKVAKMQEYLNAYNEEINRLHAEIQSMHKELADCSRPYCIFRTHKCEQRNKPCDVPFCPRGKEANAAAEQLLNEARRILLERERND